MNGHKQPAHDVAVSFSQKSDQHNSVCEPIAVVGIGCWYPGAQEPRQLWENVLARRREFRRIPDVRLPLEEYYDPDPEAPDKTYGQRAALIDGFIFDWAKKRIPHQTYICTDIAQWLALEVAESALQDAGYTRETVQRNATGVILGNTLTGEWTRSHTMRLRWPFIRRTLLASANAKGLPTSIQQELVATMEEFYKSVFPPTTEDTLAGGLSNTIAGRICNYFDFHGGGYTVDGACSSSLLAVCTAANYLANGDLDMVLAGGVDISLDTFELIGFAKTGALTKSDMNVYDKRASGFLPGEGCGFVVMKRLKDARAAGDTVYAVLRGWGISSDGKGGITAPSRNGQATAIRRAYMRAGYSPQTLDFVEGHGTGTPVGDKTEIEGLAAAIQSYGTAPDRSCGITSFKSIVGHTKAAAGVGAFIKAVIAANRRVLPPTAGCTEPNNSFDTSARVLYPILLGKVEKPTKTLHVGVSAMGFGGINSHVTLESGDLPSPKLAPAFEERALLVSNQESEVFVFGASSVPELLSKVQALSPSVESLSLGDFVDLAADLSEKLALESTEVRAALVANTPETLSDRLNTLVEILHQDPPKEGEIRINQQQDIWVSNRVHKNRLGFLIPGQGSQQLLMARVLVERYTWARELVAQADEWVTLSGGKPISSIIFRPLDRASGSEEIDRWKQELSDTQVAQPAICLASVLYARYLDRLGIRPSVVGGHSLGELTAFHLAGAFNEADLIKLATLRGQAMMASAEQPGAMVSLACTEDTAKTLIKGVSGYVVIANINSLRQIVVSGEKQAVEELMKLALQQGITAKRLPVSNAFHSQLVATAAQQISNNECIPEVLGEIQLKIISSMRDATVEQGIKLREHFSSQLLAQVDFVRVVEQMQQVCDLMIEVGPAGVLSGLVRDILGTDRACLPVASKPNADRDLNKVVAAAFVHGVEINWTNLYDNRLVRPFVSGRLFIDNPCERPFTSKTGVTIDPGLFRNNGFLLNKSPSKLEAAVKAAISEVTKASKGGTNGKTARSKIEEQLLGLVAKRTGYPLDSISLKSRLLDDLNLDSIKAAELVAAAAKQVGVEGKLDPSELSNASLTDVATAIYAASGESSEGTAVEGVLLDLVAKRTGYPLDTISLESKLLDDLNLDSIKAADMVATAAKQVGVGGKLDPSTLANATLGEVSVALRQALAESDKSVSIGSSKPAETSQTKGDRNSNWVRNFSINYVPSNLQDQTENWQDANVLIVADREEIEIVRALREQLLSFGASVEVACYSNLSHKSNTAKFSHRIAVLPQTTSQDKDEVISLSRMVERLKSIATPSRAGGARKSCIAYVQFGGGYFGTTTTITSPEVCCAAAFARSIHHERPDLRVRVIDLCETIEPIRAAGLVIRELSGNAACITAGYNASLERLEPQARLDQPLQYVQRQHSWSDQDVILVTGGAKGITAECALAVARITGAKLALVGSSPISSTDARYQEVARTLERFNSEGLTCRYYSCNIIDYNAVANLVTQVAADLGSISAVIHGAGVNKPRRFEQASLEDAVTEVSPKVLGAYNLLQALGSAPPKLFIAFTSIIGVTGMPGNALYAFSNESLDLMLRRFEVDHPQTNVQSVAYSVWSEVGMGARMGSMENLGRMGIEAIPTTEGVNRFVQLFTSDPGAKQVVIAARLGGLDTWSPVLLQPSANLRFIEQVNYCEPGVELKVRTRLTLERDLYVQDHIYRGSYLFPTVFGLEAMAQATAYVTGEQQPSIIRIEDVSLQRPVVVDPTEGVEIEIHVEVSEIDAAGERRVKAGIRTEQTGFTSDHFAATLILGDPKVGDIAAPEFGEALDINPLTDLYGSLLFQGTRFQRMSSIFQLSREKSLFQANIVSSSELGNETFAIAHDTSLVLGDPYFRDVLLQAMQLNIPQDICLPVHIDKIELFHNPSVTAQGSSRIVTAILNKREGREYFCEVIATDDQGHVVEHLTGYRLRILEEHPENPTAVELAFPEARDERNLQNILQSNCKALGLNLPTVSLGLESNLQPKTLEQRRQRQRPIITRALQTQLGLPPSEDIVFEIETLPSGKPLFSGAITQGLNLSLSHDDRYCLCVVGSTPQGCDIEPVANRTADDWMAILGTLRSSVVDRLVKSGESRDRAATRVWSALESIRKAFNGVNPEFSVEKQQGDAVLLRTQIPQGLYFVLTLPIRLTRGSERMIAVIVSPEQITSEGIPSVSSSNDVSSPVEHSDRHRIRYTDDGPQGQQVYEQRFQVSFKESASISRRVFFSQYISWIGKIREFAMERIGSQLVSDFFSEWGMVTNKVSLRIVGEATTYDVIQARCWLGNVVGSTFDSYIEFCKVLPDNSLERLALGEVKATWVRLVDYGVPAPRKFPEYLDEFLNRFCAKTPATIDLKNPSLLNLPPLPASLSQLESGRLIYSTSSGSSNRKVLRAETFQTTLEESNLVGNVYYGNYFSWQGRVRDLFLYSVAPEYLRVSEPRGEMICLYSQMDYLREAMPFDRVRVVLSVQSFSLYGAVFSFEFFREQPNGQLEKLHIGQQEVVWAQRLPDGTAVAAPWPEKVLRTFEGILSSNDLILSW
ncbi:SDR family NAD(P)-dependent oxidoreductase [Aetokthonos hydrillicola Thurmond2011]|jgi:acyl transferase domain-containing protein/NAD(P)-dependent dehydrogenase (short-subunit alcohol dehydrogenase family)/acyl-CoA thioesterase FadM/3-hydroxymyristoyl/3-hydroxydecanoyl-(acyl carrier protein) dehydratase|uniref:SDR family NAD(P)-dependent oxidoreductase n=1 Tax=Aetokthonos hydrillicola Thurmond2011 TaxID=2712845 RepID=A0AAP5MCI5_9CYAN|nr:type I polyketide synthase [Aetokthonos hydrillicola]MBO3462727.1 SDR family NAD(P)-dependent oxidoreductase [Aetokthonos hydrillicola CCALA 1050]MBW4585733.1 SDR family NAD(P)-dependent oxidoreductase [Aetokthonos hydrillicola CCALA 1050]MDR9899237.1 SDR family NAD(P)-dependent oxidoreductase [Aetokthonos hydrillicola Thurmond2011]